MLVFIDESGDPGLKLSQGSSRFFSIALVIFEDPGEATACEKRLELLAHELGWEPNSEFHFKRNSDRIRKAFLKAAAPYDFFFYGIVINKDPAKLYGEGFRHKQSFYKYTCSLLFENAKERLENATVVIDESGSLDFKRQLATYLRRKINTSDRKHLRKVKMQRSSSNRLLQLADYIAGVINRKMQKKKDADTYHRLIAHRQIYVQVWPK
ncbi:MAG: DUF3800 domain-containing protein [Candidatus Omnitrophica bacterium]|nr:DUF3800 domain-containing protein [Candidatus Omnitrophota bacterium]